MAVHNSIITQQQLELRYGSKLVRDLCDRDRSGTANPEVIEEVLDEASDVIRGLMLSAFTTEQMIELSTADAAFRGYCCDVAIGIASLARPGLMTADGGNPYLKRQDRAEKKLAEIATGKQRLGGETKAGRNAKIGTSVNRDPAVHVFAASSGNKVGPGGF